MRRHIPHLRQTWSPRKGEEESTQPSAWAGQDSAYPPAWWAALYTRKSAPNCPSYSPRSLLYCASSQPRNSSTFQTSNQSHRTTKLRKLLPRRSHTSISLQQSQTESYKNQHACIRSTGSITRKIMTRALTNLGLRDIAQELSQYVKLTA